MCSNEVHQMGIVGDFVSLAFVSCRQIPALPPPYCRDGTDWGELLVQSCGGLLKF